MLMVFHGVSGNVMGKRKGGDPAAFWWFKFNLKRGLFFFSV